MDYQTNRKDHLADYKKTHLTNEHGIWSGNGKPYKHILPEEFKELNILSSIRVDFWKYFKTTEVKLHKDFHHLNSSQALCFNLFYPLCQTNSLDLAFFLFRIIEANPPNQIPLDEFKEVFDIKDQDLSNKLAKELDDEFLKNNKPLNWEFEKILDKTEGTNFDFYVELSENYRVLFELKYTESEFGIAKADEIHLAKYAEIYEPMLKSIVKPDFLNSDEVLANYQIFRNLTYIDDKTTVVFLFPKQNSSLQRTENFINRVLLNDKRDKVRIVYLESIIYQIMKSNQLTHLRSVYEEFKRKYVG